MRAVYEVVVPAVLLLSAGQAEAQSAVPQSELYAAYCVGSLNAEINAIRDAGTRDADGGRLRAQGSASFVADDEATKSKYVAYLASLGAFQTTDFGGDFALVTAMRRGQAERLACNRAGMACMQSSSCGIAGPPACAAPERCRDPGSLLPFPFGQ